MFDNSFHNIKNDMFESNNLNTNLVSRKLDDYFTNLISKQVGSSSKIIKNEYTFNKFYNDYIDPNFLLLFLILGVILFLIFKYYNKYYIEDDDNFDVIEKNNKNKENLILKKQLQYVKKYKKTLDQEKDKILSIIDELSLMNYNTENKLENKNLLDDTIKSTDFNRYTSHDNHFLDNTIKSVNDFTENNDFYKVDEENSQKNELINGVYINPPYEDI
jgi:hypothetical protein